MTINLSINPIYKTNTQTGEEIKVEGGNLSFEMSAEEFTSLGTNIIKSLPVIKDGINSILSFEASESEKRHNHEAQMQSNAFAADSYKHTLEDSNQKLRDENRKLREELSDARSGKVPTKRELK